MEANPRRMGAMNESIVAAAWAPEAERRRRGTALRVATVASRRCNVLQAVCTRAPRVRGDIPVRITSVTNLNLKRCCRVVFFLVIFGVAPRPRGAGGPPFPVEQANEFIFATTPSVDLA